MDKEISNDFALQNQISQDLPVAVQLFGEWGSYKPVNESPMSKHNVEPIETVSANIQ